MASQTINCRQCGAGNPMTANTCFQCGQSLASRSGAELSFPSSSPNPIASPLVHQTGETPPSAGTPFLQSSQKTKTTRTYDPNLWWQALLLGTGLWGTAALFFVEATRIEASGGIYQGRSWVMLLYYLAGKWVTAVLLGLVATIVLGYGIYERLRSDR